MSDKDLLAVAGLAKSRVDAGFSRVGRRLAPDSAADAALMILAARAIAEANAVMVLCERGLANESLPVVRGLAEACLAMRWIAEADSDERAARTLEELRAPDWGTQWPTAPWRDRAAVFGLDEGVERFVLASAADFARGAAQGLPWGHAVAERTRPGASSRETLKAVAILLGHALKALDARWAGEFPGAAEMWEKAAKL